MRCRAHLALLQHQALVLPLHPPHTHHTPISKLTRDDRVLAAPGDALVSHQLKGAAVAGEALAIRSAAIRAAVRIGMALHHWSGRTRKEVERGWGWDVWARQEG